MRAERPLVNQDYCDTSVSLDWTSLGRLVRRETLEAVTRHFLALAAREPGLSGREPARSERGAKDE